MIERDIFVTRHGFQEPIQVVHGTDMMPVSINVVDYTIPSGSAAVAYNKRPDGKIMSQVCDISGNVITFTPEDGFFGAGHNHTQFRVTYNNRNLFSFVMMSWCDKNICTDDAEEVYRNPTLLTQLLSKIGVLSARMDTFTALPDGSTAGDAELQDGRVGYDGVTYPNIGEAIRGQVGSLSEEITKLDENVNVFVISDNIEFSCIKELYMTSLDEYRIGNIRKGYHNGDGTYEWRIIIIEKDTTNTVTGYSYTSNSPDDAPKGVCALRDGFGYIVFDWDNIEKDTLSGGYPSISKNATDISLCPAIHSILNIMPDISKLDSNNTVFSWVDDDTIIQENAGIEKCKEIADDLNIKCSFACITNRVNDDTINLLKQYQLDGFQITTHSSGHTKEYWNPSEGEPNLSMCEKETIESLIMLRNNGFVNYDDMIIPFGRSTDGIINIVKKYCKSGVLAGTSDGITHLYGNGIYKIKRCFIRKNGYSLEEYKTFIDEAIENNDMLIFGTHSGNSDEWDENLVRAVFNYVIEKGFTITTLNESIRKRKPLFDAMDIYLTI